MQAYKLCFWAVYNMNFKYLQLNQGWSDGTWPEDRPFYFEINGCFYSCSYYDRSDICRSSFCLKYMFNQGFRDQFVPLFINANASREESTQGDCFKRHLSGWSTLEIFRIFFVTNFRTSSCRLSNWWWSSFFLLPVNNNTLISSILKYFSGFYFSRRWVRIKNAQLPVWF